MRIQDNVIVDHDGDGIEIRLHAYSGPTLAIDIRRNLIARNGEDGIQLIDDPDVSSRVLRIEGNVIRESALAGSGWARARGFCGALSPTTGRPSARC